MKSMSPKKSQKAMGNAGKSAGGIKTPFVDRVCVGKK